MLFERLQDTDEGRNCQEDQQAVPDKPGRIKFILALQSSEYDP